VSAIDNHTRWCCRRGMKELDVLLERFLEKSYADASSEQKRAFTSLLALPDPLLAAYLLGHATPPEPETAELARLIAAGRD
jgi:antitoxin CptB